MTTTVAKIKELPVFSQHGHLLAGAKGLSNEVRYVTVMEVPDYNISSLNDDVFILTTLFAYRDNLEQLELVMGKLCKQKVAGIAVKLERFIDKLPQSVLDIADQYEVPLFTFGKDTTFRELISQISSEIINVQRELIDGVRGLNKSLVRVVLRGDKTESILKLLCNKVECYCACVSLTGELLGEYSSLPPVEEATRIKECFSELIMQNDRVTAGTAFFTVNDFCVFPCSAHEQTMGFLIIRMNGSICDWQLLYAQEIVSFLSIRFLEKYLQIETEQHMIAAILDEILFRTHSNEAVIIDRLKLLGFNPEKNHLIMRLFMQSEKRIEKNSRVRSQFDNWKMKISELFVNSVYYWKGNESVIIASFPDKSQYCSEKTINQCFLQLIEADNSDLKIDLGYSLIVNDLRKLPECYKQAKKAIEYGRSLNPQKRIYSYSDYLEMGAISHGIETSEHQILKARVITPIMQYDHSFNAQLWNTLEKSLMNSSLDAAAKKSFIHISTLRYRLDKIKSITGIDFFTPHGKFLLHLCYILSKVDSR